MAVALFIIAIAAILINGERREIKGKNASKRKYYGKLMKKEALHTGMHYKVFAATYEEDSKSAFVIINGERNPEDDDPGWFGVEIPFADVSDKDNKLLIKGGDIITKTMEGKIIIVPP